MFRTVDLHGLRITETDFPPSALLAPHVHDRTVVAVMVEGSFDLVIRGRTLACPPGTVLVEPGGERHANKVGHSGARTVVIEPTPLYELQHLDAYRDLLVSPSAFVHSPSSAIAARLRTELHARDALGEFALEELALRLVDAAAGHERTESSRPMPTWLLRARELVHERLPRLLRVHDVAAEVGVHAVYLTKIFRERFGVSLGTYQRRRRLEWAAERLSAGESVADVAHRAGFADQAHFTRAFKRFSGQTPGRFRWERTGRQRAALRP